MQLILRLLKMFLPSTIGQEELDNLRVSLVKMLCQSKCKKMHKRGFRVIEALIRFWETALLQ